MVLNENVKVQCMEYEIPHQNCFKWPGSVDIIDYEYKNIVSKIDAPEITGVSVKNKRKYLLQMVTGMKLVNSLMINFLFMLCIIIFDVSMRTYLFSGVGWYNLLFSGPS